MLAILLLLITFQGIQSDPLLVNTARGRIRGLRADDGDYSMFLGIPYGKVDPENPFGAAEPYPRFAEVFEAINDSAICPQREELSNEIKGTLDCLNLNIYVPNITTSTPKIPVLVWIHGGGFINGNGGKALHGPKYLVRHDIIVVSINYRLGPYGFMCLDIPEVSGNQGFKDQTLALRWIRDNIEAFGGDSNKITVYGESAGAASVEFHLVSENEKLFQQVILGSGAIFSRWRIGEIDNTAPTRLAARLGLQTDNVQEALSYLKDMDVKKVIEANTGGFRGCVEKRFDSVEGFLHEHPFTMKTIPKAVNMSIITGYNDHEMLMSYVNTPPEMFQNIDPFRSFAEQFPEDQFDEIYNFVRRFYIGDADITEDVRWDLIDFNSDSSYNHPSHRSLNRFLKSGVQRVYHYIFSYTGGRNMVKARSNITVGGAAHADELGYVFDMHPLANIGDEADYITVDRMTTLWANFVKYGNPTPEVTQLLPVVWPVATNQRLNYLDIGSNLVLGTRPFHDRMTFWDLFVEAFPHETTKNAGFVNRSNPTLFFIVMYSLWKLISYYILSLRSMSQ